MRSKLTKSSRLAGVAVGIAIIAGLPGCTPTMGNGICNNHEICLWEDGGQRGAFRDWEPEGQDPNWSNDYYTNGTGPLEDTVSSVANNSDTNWLVMNRFRDYAGYRVCIGPNVTVRDLESITINGSEGWSNKTSSHSFSHIQGPPGCNKVIINSI
jgi:hypothetical protein